MFASLIRKMRRDKRAATAMLMAIMLVPLLIAAGAAVDFSRVAASRTLLQAAVDGAATAGAGEWQMSESSTDADATALHEYANTGAQLTSLASQVVPTVALYCSSTATVGQCGGTYAFSSTFDPKCNQYAEYCVVVTAKVLLTNSLLSFVIPSEYLSASTASSVSFPNNPQPQPAPPSPIISKAGSFVSTDAYAVPLDSGGNPEYDTLPIPTTGCASDPGVLKYLVPTNAVNGACNYLFIADSLGTTGNGGTISANASDPIAFSFYDESGEEESPQYDTTHYTNNICVSTMTPASGNTPSGGFGCYADGYVVAGLKTCTRNQVGCNPSISSGTPLYGICPAHNLYGSIYQNLGTNAGGTGMGDPLSDSINTLSSAYEANGQPPTYETNRIVTPFISNINASGAFGATAETVGSTTYYVEAECPNYSIAGTGISAPVSNAYVATASAASAIQNEFAGMNTFSTWYPTGLANDLVFPSNTPPSDGVSSGVNDVFPPAIGACTPATNAADGGITPVAGDPWWNWSGSNITSSPGNFCSAAQPSTNTDCALLIQPLGTNVPTGYVSGTIEGVLPDYYLLIESASGVVLALDPVWDNTASLINGPFTDLYPGAITTGLGGFDNNIVVSGGIVTDNDAAGFTPTGTNTYPYTGPALSANGQIATTVVIEQPAETNGNSYDHSMPQQTSHQCYDPTVAQTIATPPDVNASSGATIPAYYSNGMPIDPIANPQYGAVICNSTPPESYALYWNDMGGYDNDDLGYWNAVFLFTCSVPASSNTNGGGSYISG